MTSRLPPFAANVPAMLPAKLGQAILATAVLTIAADLQHLADVSWVVTAHVVAAAATTPVSGKRSDRRRSPPELPRGRAPPTDVRRSRDGTAAARHSSASPERL